MPNYKKILIIIFPTVLSVFVLFNFSFAAGRQLEVPIPGLETETLPALPEYIVAIYNFALMIIGLICFGALIYGGFRYIISAGKPADMADAKDQIFSALLGLIILFCSYLILTTINPELVIFGEPGKGCASSVDCPEGQECVGGICSAYPVLPGGSWSGGCSGYVTSDDCTRATCTWCPGCSGQQADHVTEGTRTYIGVDKCVDSGTGCGYACSIGECGAESCE